ncbi:MAG: universal stress protein [Xanthomonadales bacterium]|nr:universal stress protein [Xanthomonadales bacterium]
MFTGILAATDFSADGELALERALHLAPATASGTVTALHVVEAGPLSVLRSLLGEPGEAERLARDGATQRLHASLSALSALAAQSGAKVRPEVRVGRLLPEVLDAAAGDDLLVVGARGHHALRRSLGGSTPARLARAGRQAVLVVRRPVAGPYSKVLAALDLSDAAARILAAARWVAGQGIQAVHALDFTLGVAMAHAGVKRDAIEWHRQRALAEARLALVQKVAAAGFGDEVESVVHEGYPTSVLMAQIEASDADLLVLGKQGGSALDALFLGSVSNHLLAEAPCDVLIVP